MPASQLLYRDTTYAKCALELGLPQSVLFPTDQQLGLIVCCCMPETTLKSSEPAPQHPGGNLSLVALTYEHDCAHSITWPVSTAFLDHSNRGRRGQQATAGRRRWFMVVWGVMCCILPSSPAQSHQQLGLQLVHITLRGQLDGRVSSSEAPGCRLGVLCGRDDAHGSSAL